MNKPHVEQSIQQELALEPAKNYLNGPNTVKAILCHITAILATTLVNRQWCMC